LTEADIVTRDARDDAQLVARLRAGDERAFDELVRSFYPAMLAVARAYARTRAVADEIVQDAWLAVLNGIDRFEGRSSLRTWVLQIVANIARTRAAREARTVPFSSFEPDEGAPAVDPARFRGSDEPYAGHWRNGPTDWSRLPEERLASQETIGVVRAAIETLPESQRLVITLRDVVGCTTAEVCDALELSPENQRVLLHRARARVRDRLEEHLG
jgi:RNA polymerase sigma-70 factor, ECF subfamily